MVPLKIFLNLKAWLETTETLTDLQSNDPFRHPDIRAMDLRQLADLPFPRLAQADTNCNKAPLAKCA
ncbi:Hypothetical protein NGAL_HAMBI1146_40380 [Neorhizobium galegae bv. officinalis]|nr:Hypothetical protein NGAL_HAMBI1146_40380 [Neorhizobium galegae bv. officinalis]